MESWSPNRQQKLSKMQGSDGNFEWSSWQEYSNQQLQLHKMKEVSNIKHHGMRFTPSLVSADCVLCWLWKQEKTKRRLARYRYVVYGDSGRNNSLPFQMFFSVTYKYDWFVPDCKFPLRLFTTTCLCCVLKNIFSKSISKLFERTEVEFNTFYFSIVEKNERTKWITANSMEFVLLSKFYL